MCRVSRAIVWLVIVFAAMIIAHLATRSHKERDDRGVPAARERSSVRPDKVTPREAPFIQEDSLQENRASSSTLPEATEANIKRLLTLACRRDLPASEQARRTLVAMGNDAVPHLGALLDREHSPTMRRMSAEILTAIDTPEAWEELRASLGGTDKKNVKQIIASGIVAGVRPGMEERIEELITFESELAQQVHAGRKLGQMGGAGSVDDWVDGYYRSDNDAQRSTYAEALDNLTDPEAVPRLEEILTGDDDELLRSAATSLARIGTPRSVGVIVETMRRSFDAGDTDHVAQLSAALSHVPNRAVLESFRNDYDQMVRRAVDEVLEQLQDNSGGHNDAAGYTRKASSNSVSPSFPD